MLTVIPYMLSMAFIFMAKGRRLYFKKRIFSCNFIGAFILNSVFGVYARTAASYLSFSSPQKRLY
jgi:hypothetical protein